MISQLAQRRRKRPPRRPRHEDRRHGHRGLLTAERLREFRGTEPRAQLRVPRRWQARRDRRPRGSNTRHVLLAPLERVSCPAMFDSAIPRSLRAVLDDRHLAPLRPSSLGFTVSPAEWDLRLSPRFRHFYFPGTDRSCPELNANGGGDAAPVGRGSWVRKRSADSGTGRRTVSGHAGDRRLFCSAAPSLGSTGCRDGRRVLRLVGKPGISGGSGARPIPSTRYPVSRGR